MSSTMLTNTMQWFHPARWTGPIFDKELRVASRRRRYYVLRFFYVALLAAFIIAVWSTTMFIGPGTPNVYQVSRMAEIGKSVTTTIIWFQFIALHIITITMLGNTITEEIRKQTLGILMTTPITSVQIVLGKLFSRLLQPLILLALSLPLLAIIRVFGGVQWDYVISSLCITITAIFFAGVVSLTVSISNKKSRTLTSGASSLLVLLYLVLPLLLQGSASLNVLSQKACDTVIFYTNPFVVLSWNTRYMIFGGAPFTGISLWTSTWQLHCLGMVTATILLVFYAVWRVRRAALHQAWGDTRDAHALGNRFGLPKIADGNQHRIRRVKGSCVTWKEYVDRHRSIANIIGVIIIAVIISISYLYTIRLDEISEPTAHVTYVVVYYLIALLMMGRYAAGSITTEKEARTWPILLTTPLDDWQIILGKAKGIVRRGLPIWLVLGGHVFIFTIVGYIHPGALLQLPFALLSGIIYFIATGLFFSSCIKRTSIAVSLTLGIPLLLILFSPACILGSNGELMELLISVNPVFQAGLIIDATAGADNAGTSLSDLKYEWPTSSREDIGYVQSTVNFLVSTFLFSLIALFFAALAVNNLRKNIFGHT